MDHLDRCPLCGSKKLKYIEKINKNSLLKLYKNLTGSSYEHIIKSDITYQKCTECKLYFYNPLFVGDKNFYDDIQKFDWYYLDDKEEYRFASKLINSHHKVLDVGSGKGAFSKFVNKDNYLGLDFNQEAINKASLDGIKVKNEFIENFANDNSGIFDFVVSFQVLEHVKDPKSFLSSKILALKPGGKLIIAVPSEDSFLKFATNNAMNMPPHHVTRWTDHTLREIANIFDLKLIDVYHEQVQEIHIKWYYNIFLNHLFINNKLIDMSLIRKFINLFFHFISKWISKRHNNFPLPNGHTVVAIYEKK
ncbi:class I SAM-dependent methyltransferase [Candidatus Kapabacteria bacterium]|nr:class I SAM-dependent methyltransferase [Candidatus Kapabacteria bacterium]